MNPWSHDIWWTFLCWAIIAALAAVRSTWDFITEMIQYNLQTSYLGRVICSSNTNRGWKNSVLDAFCGWTPWLTLFYHWNGRVATIEVSLKHYVRNPHIEPTKKEKLESRSVCHHSKRRWLSSDLMLSRVYWRGKVDLFHEDRPQGVLEVFFQDRFPAALRHVDEGF